MPIMRITACGGASTKRKALRNGSGLLTIPIDFETLHSEIQMCVERAA
jgi:hypothetical protein